MGRLAVLDKSIESRLKSSSSDWSIGLLIGSATDQKDYVVHYANTFLEEQDRNKSLSTISDSLVTSHVGELQRMLPGGLCICGITAIASANDLNSSHIKLQQIMLASYKRLRKVDFHGFSTNVWHLLLVDQLTGHISSKSLDVSDYKSSLKPSEVKFQSLNSGWLIAETILSVDMKFCIKRQQEDQHFEQQLLGGLVPLVERVNNSVVFFNGVRRDPDDLLGESGKGKKSSQTSLEPTHVNVQLYSKPTAPISSSCDEVFATVWIRGSISAMSFLRAPASATLIAEAVKSDLKKSLTVRCQLLCEDILQVGSEKHVRDEQFIYETPPRVYIPHSTLPVVFTDYMFKDEKAEDCAERAQQILGTESPIDSSSIDTSIERPSNSDDLKMMEDLCREDVEEVNDSTQEVGTIVRNLGRIASGGACCYHKNCPSMLLCNFCSDNPKVATIACENCAYYYCSGCAKRFHPKVGPLKTHNLINASALSHEERSCLLHDGFKFTVYCMSCMQLLCLRCVPDHASHSLEEIEKAFNKAKSHLKDLSEQLHEHFTRSNKVKQETEEHIQRLKVQKEGRASEKKIRLEVEFLRSAISGSEKNMIQTVQQQLREKVSSLNEAVDRIPRLTAGSMSVLNDLSGILENNSFMHVLSKFGELNSKAQSQLDLLDSVEMPSDVQLGFDYENFECADVVNIIADKLSILPSNPHALLFSGTSSGSRDTLHSQVTANQADESPPQRDLVSEGAEIPMTQSDNRLFTKQLLPQTFLARAVTKHPEFLRQAISVSNTLTRQGYSVEDHFDLNQSGDKVYNDHMLTEHSEQDCGEGVNTLTTVTKQSRLRKLEEIWHRETSDKCDSSSMTSERTSLSSRLFSAEDSIPATATGATQRAKEGYYSAYQLTSDRSYKEDITSTDQKSQ